jgi:hypothetical protein
MSYYQACVNYSIAVNPLNDGRFDVQFMKKNTHNGISIEVCNSEHNVVEGAKKFPTFYEIALKYGLRVGHQYKRN